MVLRLAITLVSVLEALMLVTVLSTDAFVASFAYGANRIRIPFSCVLLINIICRIILAASLLLGALIRPYITESFTKLLSFAILLVLGIAKLFDSAIKSMIRKHKNLSKKINFSAFHLKFILTIYADPEEADSDASRVLSPLEAVSLAIALSLDSLAAGFGAAIAQTNLWLILIFSFCTDFLAIMLGGFVGRKVSEKCSLNLSWVSGLLLIVLAVLKL